MSGESAIVFSIDQVIHLVTPLGLIVTTLLTAAGRAIWKKLKMMQAQIDEMNNVLHQVAVLHENNHPGQRLDV